MIFYHFYPIAPSNIWLVNTATKQQQKRGAVSRCLKSERQRSESLKLFFLALWIAKDFLSLCFLPCGCSLRPRNSQEMLRPSRFQISSSPIKLQPWNLEQRSIEANDQAHKCFPRTVFLILAEERHEVVPPVFGTFHREAPKLLQRPEVTDSRVLA